MKRFIFVLILTIVIVGVLTCFMPRSFDSYAIQLSKQATVSIYCRQTTSDDAIDMGTGYIVECDTQSYANTLDKCTGVDGVSVSFCGYVDDVAQIVEKFNLQTVSICEIDGLYVVCGASDKIKGGVTLDGAKVNLQIAYKDGVVTVGSPLILGSY